MRHVYLRKMFSSLYVQIPIVDDEIKKAAGEIQEDEMQTGGPVQKLVTADDTYATQSAFSTTTTTKKEERQIKKDMISVYMRVKELL